MRLYVQDERQLYNKQPCESRTHADAELTVPKHLHLPKKERELFKREQRNKPNVEKGQQDASAEAQNFITQILDTVLHSMCPDRLTCIEFTVYFFFFLLKQSPVRYSPLVE